MKVLVRFFAQLKDATGASQLAYELPDGARVSELLAMLYRGFSGLEKWDAHIRVAVGVEWVVREHALRDGDSVSIMPPVSGG